MYEIDAAILMNQNVWQASGHTEGFADPLVECTSCKRRFRTDMLSEPFPKEISEHMDEHHKKNENQLEFKCINCGKMNSTKVRQFNMMFKTHIGAAMDESGISYLRPETAQGMFVNFKNIVDSFHPELPFGMAQIGKAFRNEIAPRDFMFRSREFSQMEIEYFVRENEWEKYFEMWRKEMLSWMEDIGLSKDSIHEVEVSPEDRAHYSKRTIDFEFEYPFGKKELYGLAYRTDFDLKSHMEKSGVDLRYYDEKANERFLPHVIEPTFGIDRTVMAVLLSAYTEDEMGNEKRTVLKLPYSLAPIKVAVFPLLKNKLELVEKAKDIFSTLRKTIPAIAFDDNGNIGKRYRRQDEIGTPFCVTVDFQTLEDNTVTVRERDSGKQERISVDELPPSLKVE